MRRPLLSSFIACVLLLSMSSLISNARAQGAAQIPEDFRCVAADRKFGNDAPSHHRQHHKPLHLSDGRDAEDLYYGLSGPVDDKEAMKVAELDGPDAILAMLYANGYGVARDLLRSEYYICHSDWPADGIEGMLDKVAEMKATGRGTLEVCDYAPGGAFAVTCSALRKTLESRSQMITIATLSSSWSEDAQRALGNLLQRASTFFRSKAEAAEVDARTGTGYTALVNYDVHAFEGDLVTELQWFSQFHPTDKDFSVDASAADQRLNLIYATCVQTLKTPSETTAMKNSERLWLSYRDAWTALYTAVWKGRYEQGVTENFAKAIQTRKRAQFLDDKDSCTGNIWHH